MRDVGRSTLVKMATSLGPKYLKYIVKEMKDSLTRGYMVTFLILGMKKKCVSELVF